MKEALLIQDTYMQCIFNVIISITALKCIIFFLHIKYFIFHWFPSNSHVCWKKIIWTKHFQCSWTFVYHPSPDAQFYILLWFCFSFCDYSHAHSWPTLNSLQHCVFHNVLASLITVLKCQQIKSWLICLDLNNVTIFILKISWILKILYRGR